MSELKVEYEKAIRVLAFRKNFVGDSQQWQDAFYKLWQYQQVYEFAHKIIMDENAGDKEYVNMIIRPAFKDVLKMTMESFGYRCISFSEETIASIDPFQYSELKGIRFLYYDYS